MIDNYHRQALVAFVSLQVQYTLWTCEFLMGTCQCLFIFLLLCAHGVNLFLPVHIMQICHWFRSLSFVTYSLKPLCPLTTLWWVAAKFFAASDKFILHAWRVHWEKILLSSHMSYNLSQRPYVTYFLSRSTAKQLHLISSLLIHSFNLSTN